MQEADAFMKSEKNSKKLRPWIILVVILVVITVIVVSCNNAAKKLTEGTFVLHEVKRGNISSTITGSGKTESPDSVEIQLANGIKTEEINVKVGDYVHMGDVLATLDAESVKSCAASLEKELSALSAQLAMKSTQEAITASVGGRVKHIVAKVGDSVVGTVNEKGTLAVISADGFMRIDIETEEELSLTSEVTVKWADGEESGQIIKKTEKGCTVIFDDEEAPYGMDAEVVLNGKVIGNGKIAVNSPVNVYGTGGVIEKIHVEENDKVSVRSKLFSIENGPLSNSYTEALYSYNEKAEELRKVIAYLENPVIISEVDGTVAQVDDDSEKSQAQGMDVYPSAGAIESSDAFIVINTGGAVKMTIDVDEIDIDDIELSQEAIVTLDAYPSESFNACVTHISKMGTTGGSITTYSVELTLDYDERILEGMNGSAVITVESVENVLMIPVDAIHEDTEGVYVYRGKDNENKERVKITTGLSDGIYAEATDGISEGDILIYTDTSMMDMMLQFSQAGGGFPQRGED